MRLSSGLSNWCAHSVQVSFDHWGSQYHIDVTKGTILSNVTLDEQSDSLNNLFWDYSAAAMYAALSANVSELLVKVNITTGDFSLPIGRGPNFNSFGLVAIDVPTHYIYSLCPVSSTNSSIGIWGFDLTTCAALCTPLCLFDHCIDVASQTVQRWAPSWTSWTPVLSADTLSSRSTSVNLY